MPRLVFDVGMNNGDDTSYYLHQGCRVVAIEADPQLCRTVSTKFSREVSSGQLVIENVGIARDIGEMVFWVSSKTVWSSFDQKNATKGRATGSPVGIPTLTFASLTAKHGVPHFAKIDIEGNDIVCIEQLTRDSAPTYLSIEMQYGDGDAAVEHLGRLGYTAFKLVRQGDFFQLTPENCEREFALRRVLSRLGPYGPHLRRVYRPHLRRYAWHFSRESSGPMSFELPGPWLSPDDVITLWGRLHQLDAVFGFGGRAEWYDIHATRVPAHA